MLLLYSPTTLYPLMPPQLTFVVASILLHQMALSSISQGLLAMLCRASLPLATSTLAASLLVGLPHFNNLSLPPARRALYALCIVVPGKAVPPLILRSVGTIASGDHVTAGHLATGHKLPGTQIAIIFPRWCV